MNNLTFLKWKYYTIVSVITILLALITGIILMSVGYYFDINWALVGIGIGVVSLSAILITLFILGLFKRAKMEDVKESKLISGPLFIQSLKANWVLWLVLTLGSAAIFVIINIVVGSKNIFTNIDMGKVAIYVQDENMNWLQILGLLEQMGFSLSRIQVMSQIDMNAVFNDLIYKIAGVMLPLVYIMIVSNKLIAAQVSDGSMAYVLSTPTNRKKVLRTQILFLFLSVTLMYVVIMCFTLGSEQIADAVKLASNPNSQRVIPLRTVLYTFGSYLSILALGGLCFFSSCFFNKSNKSIALGGGACIFCFLCCILGLFGSKVFVSVGVGVEAMNVFNYMTVFTLVDTDSMGCFAKTVASVPYSSNVDIYAWIYKCAILVVIAVGFTIIGSKIFVKKDLPL